VEEKEALAVRSMGVLAFELITCDKSFLSRFCTCFAIEIYLKSLPHDAIIAPGQLLRTTLEQWQQWLGTGLFEPPRRR